MVVIKKTGEYDVIIVGGGPAGIFAALELSRVAGLAILLIEKGKDIDKLHCDINFLGRKIFYSFQHLLEQNRVTRL